MTIEEVQPLIEAQYIDYAQSHTVKVLFRDGSMVYGEFIRLLQEDDDIRSNKWLFTTAGNELLLEGEKIMSISKSNAAMGYSDFVPN